jgi:hypothetical protein
MKGQDTGIIPTPTPYKHFIPTPTPGARQLTTSIGIAEGGAASIPAGNWLAAVMALIILFKLLAQDSSSE